MRIHMVGTILGIIFQHEDCRVIPIWAVRDRIYHTSKGQIIVGYIRRRPRMVGTCPSRVIVGEL